MSKKYRLSGAQIAACEAMAQEGAFTERMLSGCSFAVLRQVEPSSATSWGRRERIADIREPTMDVLLRLGLVVRVDSIPTRYELTDNGRKVATPLSQTDDR